MPISLIDVSIVAAVVIAYTLVSERLETTILTGPLLFTLLGLLLGPHGVDLVAIRVDNEFLRTLAELTLVLVLFADASRIDVAQLRRRHQVPVRLLGIGLPLTIAAGMGAAVALLPGLSVLEAGILAAILAPTDAALGQAVVDSPSVPQRIRQALNVESGLNDGISVPFATMFVAGAIAVEELEAGAWLRFGVQKVVVGAIVGVAVGLIGGRAIDAASRAGLASPKLRQLAVLSLPIFGFAISELAGGNGFVTAFAAGATLGTVTRDLCTHLFDFTDQEGHLLVLLAFLLFGGAFVGPAMGELDLRIVLYAVVSLTLVRMVPVAASQLGLRLRFQSLLFAGWFGPRGLATIVLALGVVEEEGLAGGEEIFVAATWTVFISVIAHGITAAPLSGIYGRFMARHRDAIEWEGVHEHPPRRSTLPPGKQ